MSDTKSIDTPCINWPGAVHRGYGTAWHGGKNVRAHRLAYEKAKGPIPEGLTIDHLCRNRRCVNPDHLEAVTIKENVLRGFGPSAIHARQTHCCHGHELTSDNLVANKKGWRRCKTCQRKHGLTNRRRKKREWGVMGHRFEVCALLAPGLAHITTDGDLALWSELTLRTPRKCAATGMVLNPGDRAFGPIGNQRYRSARLSSKYVLGDP